MDIIQESWFYFTNYITNSCICGNITGYICSFLYMVIMD